MPEADTVPEGVDPARPSPARLYDYYLGGTHNYEADRQAAEQLRQRMPELADAAWANRGFHGRAAIWMAEQGVRQLGPSEVRASNANRNAARLREYIPIKTQ